MHSPLRFTLALKLRTLRRARGLSLQQLADASGLAVSYLSEIEKARKYPKPEKLLDLAAALGVEFDELVSQRVDERLQGVRSMVGSEWFQEFPFELFGLETEDVFGLVSRDPDRAGALARTFLEVGRSYDVHVEQFLLAALRSYQQLNRNHFEDLERAAAECRERRGWSAESPPDSATLAAALVADWGYRIDEETLSTQEELKGLRSLYIAGDPPQLMLNGRLKSIQKAFVLARELGFRELGLTVRPTTSSWLTVESFDQVLNNFRASYFAGALLLDRDRLSADLTALFAEERWRPDAVAALLARYRSTPETLLHRLTEILPIRFGLDELFFLRFTHPVPEAGVARRPVLTKVYNMSRVAVPHGLGLNETYCRRWPALRPAQPTGDATTIDLSRLHFQAEDAEFLVLTTSRPLALESNARSTVALGFLHDDNLRRAVRFADDPAVPRLEVDLTCERCGLLACAERGAPPRHFLQEEAHARRVRAVAAVIADRRRPVR